MQLMGMKTIFTMQGYEVTKALNGYQAIQEIKAIDYNDISPNEVFSVVMMDLSMPVMNGFDGCEKIIKFFETDREVNITISE